MGGVGCRDSILYCSKRRWRGGVAAKLIDALVSSSGFEPT